MLPSSPLPSPLSPAQQSLLERPFDSRLFLEGPAGCGKTIVGTARLLRLLEEGVPAESILVLVPHRPLAEPYFQALHSIPSPGRIDPSARFDQADSVGQSYPFILTIAGLARRAVSRFWSSVAGPAGFGQPRRPPAYLNHETAQYVMALVVRPLLAQGYFETVTVQRSRLYSQILEDLNRAAGAGFPYTEIARRLKAAWTGEAGQLRGFDNLQDCAIRFRQFCLAHNLLDFSLLMDVFSGRLWPDPQVQDVLAGDFQHLIADNLEEDVAASHDVLRSWLPRFASALLIYDHDAGYRTLLGADPHSAYTLKSGCDGSATLDQSFIIGPGVGAQVESLLSLAPEPQPPSDNRAIRESIDTQYTTRNIQYASQNEFSVSHFPISVSRFFPQMLDWTASQVAGLVHQSGISPREIAILVPGLNDAVLFALSERLGRESVPVRSFRPSRPLRDQPAVSCLLTLAALAHPGWFGSENRGGFSRAGIPSRYDLAYALVQAIEGLDLVRAQLLAEIVYRMRDGFPALTSFDAIRPDMQERITYSLGERYDTLWGWLQDYRSSLPLELDEFWEHLLDDVLLQPGFGIAGSLNARQAAANLVDSARNFRQAVEGQPAPAPRGQAALPDPALSRGEAPLGLEYTRLIQEGIAPAQYLRGWQEPEEDAVLIAPAYTFLFTNRPVDVQFWLDAGSRSWGERPYQPLTHPYVLSRQWPEERPWTDANEVETGRGSLYRLILGLARRCRSGIEIGASQLSERGYEQAGPLLRWLQRMD